MWVFRKNSLAITGFHAKKTQNVQLFENPPSWNPPIRDSRNMEDQKPPGPRPSSIGSLPIELYSLSDKVSMGIPRLNGKLGQSSGAHWPACSFGAAWQSLTECLPAHQSRPATDFMETPARPASKITEITKITTLQTWRKLQNLRHCKITKISKFS